MAKRKPSERKKVVESSTEIDIVPMMNLMSILIPVMLLQMQMIQVYVINTTLPSLGGSDSDEPQKKPEKPPLNLTLTVSGEGFFISAVGATLVGPGGEGKPTVPKKVQWKWYTQNRTCDQFEEKRLKGDSIVVDRKAGGKGCWVNFSDYDYEALTKKLVGIKEQYQDEENMIINPEGDIRFGTIVKVMDAGRKNPSGEGFLFPNVVISAGFL